MSYTYANNVKAALSAAVGVGDVTLTIAAATSPFNPPPSASVSAPGRLTIVDNLYSPTKIEIVTYTGRTGAGPYTLTGVTRAQEGTTEQAFATGYVYQSATAADYSAFSAAASVTPIGVLGTGSDTTFDSQDEMTVTHTTLSSDSRFKRMAAVYEYTAGSSTSDSTMDFDYADIANYTLDVESPNATITPSAVTNTYSNRTFGTGTTATFTLGRTTSTRYVVVRQVFTGPCACTGFTVYLGANTNTPTGDIGYKIVRLHYGVRFLNWNSAPVLFSGQFTPTASATNTITFGSTVHLDDGVYAVVLYAVSDQDGNSDYYNIGNQSATVTNAHGAIADYSPSANSIDAQPANITASTAQVVMTLTNGAVNAGVTVGISGDYWYPSDIGKTIRGNSGHFLITSLPDLCTGGTALSGAGTAANAFDGDWVGTSCSAGTNGYVGYDFGSSKTVRGVGVMLSDTVSRVLDLAIEVSDDNFSSSTVVLNPSAQAYRSSTFYYFDIQSPTAGRYIRIRETGGESLTVMEMECYAGDTANCFINLANFANTSPITSGNWTLSSQGYLNGITTIESGTAALISTISTTSAATINAVSGGVYGGPHIVAQSAFANESVISSSGRVRAMCQLDTDKFAIAYFANSSADGYVVIATIGSDGVVSYGSPVPFALGGSFNSDYFDIVALSSTLFVVAYTNNLRACSVSGTVITIGSAVTNTTNSNAGGVSLCKVDSTRFVSVGQLVTTNYPSSVCGSVSGTTITLGSKVDLAATGASSGTQGVTCVLHSTDKLVALYSFSGSETTLRGKVLSLTGTTISAGSEATATINAATGTTFGSGNITLFGGSVVFSAASAAVPKFQAIAATVSGTTITFGTAVDVGFASSSTANNHRLFQTSTRLWLSGFGYAVPLGVSGTTITVGANQYLMLGERYSHNELGMTSSHFIMLSNLARQSTQKFQILTAKETAQSDLLLGPSVAISFNGTTYNVWNGSAARAIASSLNSVHGGTDGVWYYRNAASTWTAATTNSAIGALKQVAAFSANCMSFEELKSMSSANWTTLGFVEGNLTTYFAFIMSEVDIVRYSTPFAVDQVTLAYTSRARWDQETHNYTINMGAEDRVYITKDTAGTKSIKAVITGPSS